MAPAWVARTVLPVGAWTVQKAMWLDGSVRCPASVATSQPVKSSRLRFTSEPSITTARPPALSLPSWKSFRHLAMWCSPIRSLPTSPPRRYKPC